MEAWVVIGGAGQWRVHEWSQQDTKHADEGTVCNGYAGDVQPEVATSDPISPKSRTVTTTNVPSSTLSGAARSPAASFRSVLDRGIVLGDRVEWESVRSTSRVVNQATVDDG